MEPAGLDPTAGTGDSLVGSPQPPANEPLADQPDRLDDWTIYVLDAHSLIFQVFHALPEMTGPTGEAVGAVFGFAKDLLFLIEEKQPDAILCAFDRPGPTFRHEIYGAYKADRGEMPDDLVPQFPKIRRLLDALSIPVLDCEGFEADDVLATLARHIDEQGGQCFVVTGDKDCRQLITDRVHVYDIRKDREYDAAALAEDWGVRPDQVVDFQSLVGDKVDNVPGVPLIGPKIAAELLAAHGTLDTVLDAAAGLKQGKRRQNLIDFRDQALLSRKLVRLDHNVPIEPDWNAARLGGYDSEALSVLSSEFGFRTLGARLVDLAGGAVSAQTEAWDAAYFLVDTPTKLAELVKTLAKQDTVSLDTETTHLSPRFAELVGLSFAWTPGEAYYVPFRGPSGESILNPADALEMLRPVLEDPTVAKVGQNLKYDLVVLRGAGVRVQGVAFDTMIASYLLDAGERTHGLNELSKRYLGHEPVKIEELIGKGKNEKRMDEVPVAQVANYAAEDADIPLRLQPLLFTRLDEGGLAELNETVEVPLVAVLAEMEFDGIRVDTDRLAELSGRFGERVEALATEIEQLAGHPLNISSPKQLAEVLFNELGLPVVRRTKTGPSTDASVLEELAPLHPLPAKIIEYRQFTKLKNTYVDALPAMVHPETGRVHTSFNQVVAATGRLSSDKPNLQNIPIRTDEGRLIRSAFTADPPGWKLLAADYSQIELRILAHYSGDEALRDAFASDQDIHAYVASEVYDVPQGEVTPAQRRSAKAVNFGIIYGQTAFGLAKSLGITKGEAADFIDAYFARYPGVDRFFTETLSRCREKGCVKTILGRRRAITGVRSTGKLAVSEGRYSARQLNFSERTAVNTVIQGSAADLIKLAMLAVARQLTDEGLQAKMLLQIHDELVFECPEDELSQLADHVRDSMTNVLQLDVPLKVDVKTGENWAACE